VAETTPPTSSTANAEREQPVAESTEPAAEAAVAVEGDDQQDSPSKTKRKNRCTTCRKKVGLTGESFKIFLAKERVLHANGSRQIG
jgi:hypothetical protein